MTTSMKKIVAMAKARRAEAEKLNFLDVNVWVGKPEGFPLVAQVSHKELPEVLKRYFIPEAWVSHWNSQIISAQTGNEQLISALNLLPENYGLIVTGLPLRPAENGLLPGPARKLECIQGVRIFPKSHGFPLTKWMVGSFCTWLEEQRLPLFIQHTETDWLSLYGLARTFPNLPIIVESQVQKILYHTRPLFALMTDCPNVYGETSNFAGQGLLEYAVKELGGDRFVFGSFFPVNDPLVAIGIILDANISEENRRLIAGNNARRLREEIKI